MKKIPTLFNRVFSEDRKKKTILSEVTPGCEIVLEGKCMPTIKWDGACCAILGGEIYRRYDAKIGKGGKQKKPPEGAVPCQPEPDPITGHWPHWVKCEKGNPADKYFLDAFRNWELEFGRGNLLDSKQITTMEAIGLHFQGNPYNFARDLLVRHGRDVIPELNLAEEGHLEEDVNGFRFKNHKVLTYEKLRDYLETHYIEGIVFWYKDEPLCKIKRSDFGFEWPIKGK